MPDSQNPTHIYLTSLSVWEIAHRWNDADPDHSNPDNISSGIRETIRGLLLALREYLNPYDANDEEIPVEEVWFTGIRKTKFAKKLEQCLNQRTYEKDFLDSIFIRQDELVKWCRGSLISLPTFWFEPREIEQVDKWIGKAPATAPPSPPPKPAKLRPEQVDKQLCQEAAKMLWEQFPNMTIAAMIRREEVRLAGGKNYKEKTLRNWLGHVAPPHVRANRGRPKKDDTA